MGGEGSENIPILILKTAAAYGKAAGGRQKRGGGAERDVVLRSPSSGRHCFQARSSQDGRQAQEAGEEPGPSHWTASGPSVTSRDPATSASYWMNRSGARRGGRSGRSQNFRWRRIFSITAPSSIRLVIFSGPGRHGQTRTMKIASSSPLTGLPAACGYSGMSSTAYRGASSSPAPPRCRGTGSDRTSW